MNWYLRKSDQAVYGPVELATLRRWAADGRVLPDDQVSRDRQEWTPAPDLPDLGMDWFVDLHNGTRYGPLHLLAMSELVRDQVANGEEQLLHRSTGEVWRLGDALLPALIDHCISLQDALDTRVPELLVVPEDVPSAREGELQQQLAAAELRANEAIARADDLQQRLAAAEARAREVAEQQAARPADDPAEWRARYEKEHAARTQAEQETQARLREAADREQDLTRKLQASEARMGELEGLTAALPSRMISGQEQMDPASVLKSYNDLTRNYENLLERLRFKQEEHKAALETIARLERDATERTDNLETQTEQEHLEAEQLRAKLAEVEKNHADIVRAYRDLNDRYIRLRQQSDAPVASPNPPPATPPRAGGSEKPRVRLV